jgi:hypothetical protein
MKKTSLLVVILLAALVSAAQTLDDYPITVHVSSVRTILVPAGSIGAVQYQQLSVTINGKRFELSAKSDGSLLTLGDYNAKLVENTRKTAYESLQTYQFLFSDGKMTTFTVTGQSE